jgi:hypothetical protein
VCVTREEMVKFKRREEVLDSLMGCDLADVCVKAER